MAKTDIEQYQPGDLRSVDRTGDQVARHQAYSYALEAVNDPRCARPIPRFMTTMPWAEDDEDAQERIIAQLLASDDPYAAATDPTTTAGRDLIGKRVVVHDVRCRPSNKPGGWGAYLLCDVTLGGTDLHQIITVGAKQAVATLAFAWAQGDLPVAGTFTVVTETAKGNTVIGFVVEQGF